MRFLKPVYLILVITTMIGTISSCQKKEEPQPAASSSPLSFTSLSAEQTTIPISQTPKITATATGEGLTYTWTLSGTGSILGSGYQITYQPCCAGQNTITCVVKNSGGNQESKSVTITVQ